MGKRYPLKAVPTLKKKKKKGGRKKLKKKKISPFRQNLLGSIRPFLEPIQFFVLGASLSYGKPPKRERITRGETLAKELNLKRSDLFLTASQTRFAQGELITGSAAI